jgi:hypothetical protein
MILKAVTKAKRRVTLSICGLGFLDETEVDSIPGAKDEGAPSAKQLSLADEMQDEIPNHELHADAPQSTAVVTSAAAGAASQEKSPPSPAPAVPTDEDVARGAVEAADHGLDDLREYLKDLKPNQRTQLRKKFGPQYEDLVSRVPNRREL